jgi:hypothetical protein
MNCRLTRRSFARIYILLIFASANGNCQRYNLIHDVERTQSFSQKLESGGAGNDLDELSRDDGLPGPVVSQRELVNHLA